MMMAANDEENQIEKHEVLKRQSAHALKKKSRNKIILGILILLMILVGIVIGVLFGVGVLGSTGSKGSSQSLKQGSDTSATEQKDDGPSYEVDMQWQQLAMSNPFTMETHYVGWESERPVTLRVGQSTTMSDGSMVVELQSAGDGDGTMNADLKVSVTADCCTSTWDDVTAKVGSSAFGAWSKVKTCDCPRARFDHQVWAKVARAQ